MNKLLSKLLWGQLQAMGLFQDQQFIIADLKIKSGLRDLYGRWLEESIAVLLLNHYLAKDGDLYTVIDATPIDMNTAWKEWDQQKSQWLLDSDLGSLIVLSETTLRVLPEILTGKVLATDIMFPSSSMTMVEGVYKQNIIADYYNEVLANTIVAYIQEWLKQDSSGRIRLIEVGAGTGGTSVAVFHKLAPFREHIQEYCYTDLSKAFLLHAEKEYGPENPYLTYKIFNVEKPITGQDIGAGKFDIVIAANVLHATRKIQQTLRNVKAVLKKNGLILLNEISGNSLAIHLTFGLLEGWWLYEDPELRIPGCPGLYPESWQKVLESEGFHSVIFPAKENHVLGQQIIVAQSDGIIWQKQPLKPKVMPIKKDIKADLGKKDIKTALNKKEEKIKSPTIQRTVDMTDSMAENYIQETIIEKLSESLKVDIDKIDIDESFADYGVDSIIGVQLIQIINQALKIKLKTTDLFDYSSVNQLAKYILSQYKDEIVANSGQNFKPVEMKMNDHFIHENKVNPLLQSTPQNFRRRIPPNIALKREVVNNADLIHNKNLMLKEPIAIIGMSGRFPKSKNVNELWENLANGRDLIQEVTRWDLSQYYPEGTNFCNHGGFLDDIDQFDPLFFSISGIEATYMDPQQRIFLEESWKALEDAGYAGAGMDGRLCGVYVGYNIGDYVSLIGENSPAQGVWGNSSSIIPARLAYYLNLKGPAITVDTACSASLVAVHLACQGLWARETEMALAGGVLIQCTPRFYLNGSKAGMLSATGRCYTFDERADGFTPGEGVGVVILKRLDDAIADGDHIYGVIRGTGLNQDGTTNGITAPSVNSQEHLERYVYDTFNINPEQIQMVEAHGTGTKLGDPIEYQALTNAFRHYTDKEEYCAIGALKSNLGHTLAASGVAGLIKVLLSLQHKQIPPSLHFQNGNSYIQFKGSPFYLNTTLKDWEVEPNVKRCAVISSFGFSGTNVHMAIEEAPTVEIKHAEKPGYLIVLSARIAEQLQQHVKQLIEFCESELHPVDCGNMSYTLLLRRKHFNHRLACVARNQDELVYLLRKWLEKGKVSQIYLSKIDDKENREQQPLKKYGNECIQNIRNTDDANEYLEYLSTIAELYIHGYTLEYENLFANERYSRISLPTYPFARDRYWVPEGDITGSNTKNKAIATAIHPLLHQNTSNFTEQRFSSTFTGKEFFLKDHVVKGQPILPGVIYLEMARAAVEAAAGVSKDDKLGFRFKNVVWVRPIEVGGEPVLVHIGLIPEENGEISFEIYSESETVGAEPEVHSQGIVELILDTENIMMDIRGIQSQCNQSNLSSSQFYEFQKATGVEYGPGYKGIENLYIGEDLVLAKISLPASVSETINQYVLHPSIMNAALQASLGLVMSDAYNNTGAVFNKVAIPFALQEVEIINRCTSSMWALVRNSGGNKTGDKLQKLDVDLCDEQGNVCVRMKEFISRIMEGEPHTDNLLITNSSETSTEEFESIMMTPVSDWVHIEQNRTIITSPNQRMAIIGGNDESRNLIQQNYPNAYVLEIHPGNTVEEISQKLKEQDLMDHLLLIVPYHAITSMREVSIIEEQEQGVILCFRIMKALLILGYGAKDITWTIITTQTLPIHKDDQVNPTHASLHGFVGTMAKEYPQWKVRLIDLDASGEWPLKDIFTLPADIQGDPLIYRGGEWYRQKLINVQPVELAQNQTLYRHGGVYVVIGGAGGIGEIWSEYMIRTYQAQIIWIGRRKKDEAIKTKLDRLATLGPVPQYISADASNLKDLNRANKEIKRSYSEIHGLIHSAIGILDESLANMEEETFKAGMSAKVELSVRMAQVFTNQPLDFVLFFSSINTFTKQAGKSSYSAGCVFMDTFAHQLKHEWSCAVKVMNWGYWDNIGVAQRVPGSLKNRLRWKGIGSIESPEAMKALEMLLTGALDQISLDKIITARFMKGENSEESIVVYPQNSSSYIHNLKIQIPAQDSLIQYTESKKGSYIKLEELFSRMLWVQLSSLGMFTKKDLQITDLKTESGILNLYDRWLEEGLAVLGRRNYLRYDGKFYHVNHEIPVDTDATWEEWERQKSLWLEDRNLKAQVILVDETLRSLPAILTGKVRATDIMFPNSSMELVEGIYKNSLLSDYYNEVLANSIVAYIEERIQQDSSARIRLIEIGAGTGGTSVMVFRKLAQYRDHIQEYCYTDISKAFLMHAEKEYGPKNPYLTYKLFNVEKPIAGQSIGAGEYDIVIATNVLHATKNIRQTLRNSKAVLKTNGLMLLNEISSNSLFTLLTFGLLEGWWLYEDTALRIPGCPGLYPETWQKVLTSEGFRSLIFPVPELHQSGQQIIIAESDGFIRQMRSLKPQATSVKKEIKTKPVQQSFKQTYPKGKIAETGQTRKAVEINSEILREKSTVYFKKLVGETLGIPYNQLDSLEPLETYGIDSILVVQMINSLRKVFSDVSSTIFFEYQTIDALVEYFIQSQRESLIKLLGLGEYSSNLEMQTPSKPVHWNTTFKQTSLKGEITETGQTRKAVEINSEILREKSTVYFKKLVGETLGIPYNQLDSLEPLESYGIDSILVVQMINSLRKAFGDVSSTIFFEYQTIDALVEHFVQTQKGSLIKLLGLETQEIDGEYFSNTEMQIPSKAVRWNTTFRNSRWFTQNREIETKGLEPRSSREPIAIIGISGRYPQARNLKEYWDNLQAGKDCIQEIPGERWPLEDFYHPNYQEAAAQEKSYSKWGGFIDGFAEFDPLFFSISPRDTINIDPQERMFIESCWEVLEDAGYTREQLAEKFNRRVGVFAGVTKTGFDLYGPDLWREGEKFFPHTSFSSVANRISYLFNFQGPSMPIDTMCSSSLTAIHEACEHLHHGECDMAIAGGVNIYLHPSSYILLCELQMLSTDSKCRSFGNGGNGFVPGEGVGTVLLKRLSQAIEDEDHIYAVIRGSSINHGGKTNGYTVPNPIAQTEVIQKAFEKAGVNARTVSCIEAHGTGTALGDPIEITGLTQAFRKDTEDNGFCAISSVKSNIGHLESAAGIAGVTKIILQMQHQKLVPSLHAEELNPHINFGQTPFIVQQTLEEWKRPIVEINGESREYPRIAGISSFGAGGSNAHVVIEEYIPQDQERVSETISQQNPVGLEQAIIVLSAKDEDRLKERAQQLLAVINERQFTNSDMADMAYTLQVGREAMEERLGIIVSSIEELKRKLQEFIEGKDNLEEFYRGQVKRNKEKMAVFAADEDMAKTIAAWISKGKYTKFLDLWLQGFVFDWNKLYGDKKPRRISLPTYPFAKEQYWIPEIDFKSNKIKSNATTGVIHPLLHQNTSNIYGLQFSTTFTGEEFFLTDYVVEGQKVLPNMAYLEMASVAVEQVMGINLNESNSGIWFKNMRWVQPIIIEKQPLKIHIRLIPEENGEITYEIYGEPEAGEESVIYGQGVAELIEYTEDQFTDIQKLQAESNPNNITAKQCYERFKTMGIEYGPRFQGIEKIFVGQDYMLTKLSLPASIVDTEKEFMLHPSMLDLTLQGSVGFMTGNGGLKPYLPETLQELIVFSKCSSMMWSLIQYHNMSDSEEATIDIDFYNAQGMLCAQLNGLALRALGKDNQTNNNLKLSTSETPIEIDAGNHILASIWDEISIEASQSMQFPLEQVVMIGGTEANQKIIQKYYSQACTLKIELQDSIEEIGKKLETIGSIKHLWWIVPDFSLKTLTDNTLIEEQERGVLQVFRLIKALINLGYENKSLDWTLITIQSQSINKNDPEDPTHASIHGLIGSMAKEYRNWKVRLIDLEADCEWPITDILTLSADSRGDSIVYRGRQWYRQRLVPVNCPKLDRKLYRMGGVYVVIGGAGGIGEAWSEYMIKTYQAQIIWIGRRPKDATIQAQLERLAAMGPSPEYISADATDQKALNKAYKEIKQNYSQIHGVVHTAIVLLDQSLAKMEEERFKAALSVKVDLSVHIAQVFQKELLDFVLFFSSMQSFSKEPGQSNYAAGCTFKDAFARQLNREWPCAVKVINWGYWGSVGIVATKVHQERFAQVGIGSIEPSEAMEMLETFLTGPLVQISYFKTLKPIVMDGMNSQEFITVYPENQMPSIQDIKIDIPEQSTKISSNEIGMAKEEMSK